MSPQSLIHFFESNVLASRQDAENFAGHFRPRKIARGEFLLREGQVSDSYYFLESGVMRAYVIDPKGIEVTTGLCADGQMVFEVSSFFQRSPSQEFIVALEDTTGWHLTFEALNELFHALPQFREAGRAILVKGFAALKTRMLSMITDPADLRYQKLLKASPLIVQRVPVKHIASYLGITDTSLSRIRAGMLKK